MKKAAEYIILVMEKYTSLEKIVSRMQFQHVDPVAKREKKVHEEQH